MTVMLVFSQHWGMQLGEWRRRRRRWKTGRRRTEWTGRESWRMRITVALRSAFTLSMVPVVWHEDMRRKRHRPAVCWYTEYEERSWNLPVESNDLLHRQALGLIEGNLISSSGVICTLLRRRLNCVKKNTVTCPSSFLWFNCHHGFIRHPSIIATWSHLLCRFRLDVKLNGKIPTKRKPATNTTSLKFQHGGLDVTAEMVDRSVPMDDIVPIE